jgi:hypothetical protein
VEVGVHAGFEDGDAADFRQLCGVRFVVEGAGDEDIEVSVGGLAGRCHEIGSRYGSEFGADHDGGALLRSGAVDPFDIASLGADVFAGPGGE